MGKCLSVERTEGRKYNTCNRGIWYFVEIPLFEDFEEKNMDWRPSRYHLYYSLERTISIWLDEESIANWLCGFFSILIFKVDIQYLQYFEQEWVTLNKEILFSLFLLFTRLAHWFSIKLFIVYQRDGSFQGYPFSNFYFRAKEREVKSVAKLFFQRNYGFSQVRSKKTALV